jgi:acyl-CoA synthetase (NDP forming)/RimJ/RimL family protein N-acetyltransferase
MERSYPAHWEADVVLLDGATAHLRPIRPDDSERFRAFFATLSDETRYFRYFVPDLVLRDADIMRAVEVDHVDRVTMVATVADEITGIAVYERVTPGEAEVGFTVSDDHQGRGIGAVLLEHLAAAARERGIERFVADVLPENDRMLAVFSDAGYRPVSTLDDGVLRLVVDIEPTGEYYRVMAAREHRAEARSVERIFTPRSLAVIGVSPRPGTFGHTILTNALESGFSGEVYVVHPTAESIAGLPVYRSVEDIGEPVDLAVISVRSELVLEVVAACGRKGVQAVVVISAGFAETGPEGRESQRELVRVARENGMRVIGPNCLGVINADPAYRLNASLSTVMPRHGRIGFFCQSGSLGITLIDEITQRNLGVSTFVSAGNRADVSGNDLLQYWDEDDTTDVVLLYLESIGNPRKFTRLARRLARRKPVVAVKSGRSTQSMPLGHLTRPTRLPSAAVDELFNQSGVIQTDTVAEMFDVASLLAFQPLPDGPRVAVIGNSDALGLLASDALASRGLSVAGEVNDLGSGASVVDFEGALDAALADPAVDAILTIFVPPLSHEGEGVPKAIAAAGARAEKPVLATVVGGQAAAGALARFGADGAAERGSVPAYGTVEEAVRALALVHEYARWRARPVGVLSRPGLDHDRARSLVDAHLERHPEGIGLDASAARELLACYGIEAWGAVRVTNEDAAVEAALQLGMPVMLTSLDPRFVNRPDLGGSRTNLESERGVRLAFRGLRRTLGEDAMTDVVIQRTPPPGVACEVSSVEDPLFGPVVSFSLSGVMPRLLGDRGYRIPPISDLDAADLIRTPKASPVLFGYEGSDPTDVAALADLLVRVAWLAEDVREIDQLVLDPVVVSTEGLTVLGAQVSLAPPVTRAPASARRLPD